jgi:hypothetical protein
MHFALRKTGICFVAGAVILCCSCEKHHLGEMPEVQKEHVDVAAEPEENPAAAREADMSASPSPSGTLTPAEFFPESTPP